MVRHIPKSRFGYQFYWYTGIVLTGPLKLVILSVKLIHRLLIPLSNFAIRKIIKQITT